MINSGSELLTIEEGHTVLWTLMAIEGNYDEALKVMRTWNRGDTKATILTESITHREAPHLEFFRHSIYIRGTIPLKSP
jgi:hypothetical protein